MKVTKKPLAKGPKAGAIATAKRCLINRFQSNRCMKSRALQRCRRERVFENIERFVQIGAAMSGSHAGAETNAIERNGRIINRRDPETATA